MSKILHEKICKDKAIRIIEDNILIKKNDIWEKVFKEPKQVLCINDYKNYVVIQFVDEYVLFGESHGINIHENVRFIVYDNVAYRYSKSFCIYFERTEHINTDNFTTCIIKEAKFNRILSLSVRDLITEYLMPLGKIYDHNLLEKPMRVFTRYPKVPKIKRYGFIDITVSCHE